ncbi:O-acetyl-ADP-ribose deacetylase [Sciscionella marina]|uniref:O-acetyl-ADP-ribose deacetylase n=1 Tax=Sciscionella marina TaxID=508770 RepID=UPI0003804826
MPVARITIRTGDLTEQRVGAIVNAANSGLLGGGGVDGAIHRRGGPRILEECRELRAGRYRDGLPAGAAVATGAGELPAEYVIHTVGPVYSASIDRSAILIAAHHNSLTLAGELGVGSVAFPAISTGAFGWPLDSAARIALEAVTDHEFPGEVRFVLFGRSTEAVFAYTAARLGVAVGSD